MTYTSDSGGGGGDDDDDDEDGGLGMATVNLAALKAVLTKHQVAAIGGILLGSTRGGVRSKRQPCYAKRDSYCRGKTYVLLR